MIVESERQTVGPGWRAAPQLPLVIFPDDGEVGRVPHFDTAARSALTPALTGLRCLARALRSASGRTPELESAFDGACASLRFFLDSIAGTIRPVVIPRALPVLPVHEYFGVRRARLSPEQHAAQAAAIILRTIGDLRHALLDVNDGAAEVEALATALARLRDRDALALEVDGAASEPALPSEPEYTGLERWIVAHQGYFLLNLYAAFNIRQAVRAMVRRDNESAVELLQEASVYVRGFTAAMLHSGAFSSAYYCTVVRPTMQPPAVPVLLTGTMQAEHASYRAAIDELLEACPEPFLELVRASPALALARDSLLEADLLDIERHVIVAAVLVGNDHSIVQHEDAPVNAVSALRRMRHARAARYCSLMRFGDRFAESER